MDQRHEPMWLTLRVFLPFVAGYYVSYAFRSVNALLGLVTAPVQNLYGLIEARIEQLGVSDTGTVSTSGS